MAITKKERRLSYNGDRMPLRRDAAWAFLWAVLAFTLLGTGMLPQQYAATAQVLLPPQAGAASRIRTITHSDADPHSAARRTEAALVELLAEESVVLDEPRVARESSRRWMLLPGLVFLALLLNALGSAWRRSRRIPDRAAVREAVLLAQRGYKPALVESGDGFRVVLAGNAADRAELRVLARLSSGALVLGRQR